MIRPLAFLLALALAAPVMGGDERAGQIEAAWRDWMHGHGVESGAIAITRAGKLMRVAGLNREAGARVELASVGKSLTAICLSRLMDEGRAGFDDTLGDVLGTTGPQAGITLGALVTHSAGIGPDATQRPMRRWLDDPAPRYDAATRTALDRRRSGGKAGAFGYNNENYAILGSVIAALSGQSYRAACAPRLDPLGDFPSLRISPRAGAFDAWGGWQMSVADYARWHARNFGANSAVGARPGDFPTVLVGDGAHYGMGMFYRPMAGAHNFWHSGALCFPGFETGIFAVSWAGDWAWSPAMTPAPNGRRSLRWTARWPARRCCLDAARLAAQGRQTLSGACRRWPHPCFLLPLNG